MITNKEDNHEEGDSHKADAEPVDTTVPENDIATAFVDVRLYLGGNTEADGDGVLHHRRDERPGHALLLWQDCVGDEDTRRGEGEVRSSNDEEAGWKDKGPIAGRVVGEAHQEVADEKREHGNAKDVLSRDPRDENADGCRGEEASDDLRDHFGDGREGRFLVDREDEDGGVVEEDAKGHPAKRHCRHDGSEASACPEGVGQHRCRDAGLGNGKSDDGDNADDEKGVYVRLLPTDYGCLVPRKGKEDEAGNAEGGAHVVESLEAESRNRRANAVRNHDQSRNAKEEGANGPEPEAPPPGDLLGESGTHEAAEDVPRGGAEAEESKSKRSSSRKTAGTLARGAQTSWGPERRCRRPSLPGRNRRRRRGAQSR